MTEGYGFLRFRMEIFLNLHTYFHILIVFTKYSESEYLTEAWSPINEILKELLQNSNENFKPLSYQAIYS
jgi:hypothetical protein